MTPNPPSSSDGSPLPPRHRPTLGNLAQDTTELDLWAFDEDLDQPDEPSEPVAKLVPEPPRKSARDIPAPRERPKSKTRESDEVPQIPVPAEEKVRMNVSQKNRPKNQPSGAVSGQSKPESDFDDLENWEDVPLDPQIPELPEESAAEVIKPEVDPAPAEKPAEELPPEPEAPGPETKTDEESEESDDEFSPILRSDAAPVSLRPHLSLSKLEKVGLIVLVVLLVGGGLATFISSLGSLPTESVRAEENDFPIQGKRITVKSAKTFWRAPITDGDSPDTVRMGTQLLPVLEVSFTGGPAAIRVLFKNEDMRSVGDTVTRMVQGDSKLEIPATAGFDDPGMHAAYRTGESKPWTIEVFEAGSEDAASSDFKQLFEINISTDRR